ncbi:MAG: hypothetical protein UW95_C0008G0012 [Parcubacteria group bacterium GW2011_GWC1_45_14]|nr:MAG: hypothetical protein UW87_C0023G0006 [Candidatus Moranbacteria bacterium GW2011_GWC2_45_10]KKT94803.1 MAG: hypothetical protein UW95_C0008G0012 [Parcubacteria group bacterium GW2011_GWC1_45_14]
MALFVLSVGITGTLSLIATSVSNSNESRDAIVASQLAQEGVELVRNIRDTNVIVNPSASNVFDSLVANDACRIDVLVGSWECGGVTGFKLNYDSGATPQFLTHAMGGIATKFSRRIMIEGAANERKVVSLVWWGSVNPGDDISQCLNINDCTYAETILTDWGGEN